jgi:protein phosphatase methylesterase 1
MSALQRSALSARIARLPQLPPGIAPTVAPYAHQDEDNEEEEQETDDLGSLPTSTTMAPSNQYNILLGFQFDLTNNSQFPALFRPNRFSRSSKRSKPNDADFMPLSAASYFDEAVEVAVPSAQLTFRVYYTPPKLPGVKGTVMVCHHGAGFSALSFACFAKEVEKLSQGECGVLALDAREHGRCAVGVIIHVLTCPGTLQARLRRLLPQKTWTYRSRGSTLTWSS